MRIIITVDGLSASGKTTLARLLAERLGYIHLNSGLLYRAVAFSALHAKVDPTNDTDLCELISQHQYVLHVHDGVAKVSIDGVECGTELQQPLISQATSQLSVHSTVRALLIPHQKDAFAGRNLVAEGRDMGTVVFPDAQIKFFVSAGPEVRANRRARQLYGESTALSEVQLKALEIEITSRDQRDSSRLTAPTVAAKDAVIIDNSCQPLTHVLDSMYNHATEVISKL